jgi:RHS repeat-associated protein
MGNRLIAEYRPQEGKYYYYTSDQINSTRIVTNDSGAVVYAAAHDPFGGIQKTWTSTYDPSLKFSGKERDAESGLDYFGARYYDKEQYRFISVDPVINAGAAIGNPQRWNLYSYCGNNPIGYFDLDGKIIVPVNLPGIGNTYLDYEFYLLVQTWIDLADECGIEIQMQKKPYGAFRTPWEQRDIRAQYPDLASEGPSLHECGFAVDIRWYSLSETQRKDVVEIAAGLGIEWGNSFGEAWHFYMEVPGGRDNRQSTADQSAAIYLICYLALPIIAFTGLFL